MKEIKMFYFNLQKLFRNLQLFPDNFQKYPVISWNVESTFKREVAYMDSPPNGKRTPVKFHNSKKTTFIQHNEFIFEDLATMNS